MTPTPSAPAVPRVSYAQNMEDILLDRLFGGRPGTFVDLGAHHPVYDSNTCFFYERGWRGVNVEPLPYFHRLLAEARPRDLNLAVGVSDTEGELPFFGVLERSGLSTLSAEVAARHRAYGWSVVGGRIPVRTLAGLIDEYGIEPPDFLSIDVENYEGQVLRGTPLARWRPKVVVVEATLPMSNIRCHQAWEPLLLGQGYLFGAFNGVNRFYVREDLADWLNLLRVPVNVVDDFERLETVLLRRQVAELEHEVRRLRAVVEAGRVRPGLLPAAQTSG
jgi:FkbM family methyltransferase